MRSAADAFAWGCRIERDRYDTHVNTVKAAILSNRAKCPPCSDTLVIGGSHSYIAAESTGRVVVWKGTR